MPRPRELAESVYIVVTNNGYMAWSSHGPYAEGNTFSDHSKMWTFETIESLQARLPEILKTPSEKRGSKQKRTGRKAGATKGS